MGEVVLRQINVTQFLRQYDSSNTRASYLTGLKQFFRLMYPDGGEIDELSQRYLAEDRDYREDMQNFKDVLEGKAPKTRQSRFNVVWTFLNDNGITFPKRFLKNLNGKATESISYEAIPSNEELRRICEYLPIQGKALALVLSSSGMRIGEAVKLKIVDVDLKSEIVKIRIRAEIAKNKKKRITFISPETKGAVEEWLQFRDQYLEQAKGRSAKHKRSEDTGKLFPFEGGNFNYMWKNALEKANLKKVDPKTKRVTMRPHNLRKYFRLRVGRYGRDEVEALIGHQEGLNKIYARFSGEDGERRLEEIYKKAILDLSIYQRIVQVVQTDVDTKNQIRKLEDQVGALVSDGFLKDARISHLSKILTESKDELQTLQMKVGEMIDIFERPEFQEFVLKLLKDSV